ncbi:MAG: hypothetical protein VX627_06895 [Candidatus Thermoplasmatota archaeon]|nr:hypothetical protein [Candidatus Thermoplasmatota archaeon]
MADDDTVNPMVGVGQIIGGVVMIIIGAFSAADGGDPSLIFFGIFLLLAGIGNVVKSQQQIAKGAKVSGQPTGTGAWNRVGNVMSRVDNPDNFIIDMPNQQSRSESMQIRMNAEFHGDTIDEFRGDTIQEFRGDSIEEFRGDTVSNWTAHEESKFAPDGYPSAVPGDFHHHDKYWEDPTKQWSDPFA